MYSRMQFKKNFKIVVGRFLVPPDVASLDIGTKRKSLYCILLSVLGTNLGRCNRSRICVFLVFFFKLVFSLNRFPPTNLPISV